MSEHQPIYIIGSLNADLVQTVDRLPKAGETLTGGKLRTFPGGKGANQAFAAARMGGRVAMIGQVGRDSLGKMLVESLRSASVDTSGVAYTEGPTGAASILVLPDGENAIVISPGANSTLTREEVAARCADLTPGSLVLCQLEIPIETVMEALSLAKRKKAITILDPAPANECSAELLPFTDFLTPNETEALQILGKPDRKIESESEAEATAAELRRLGAASVVLKLGKLGCYVSTEKISYPVRGLEVTPVDTTAAGDTFNGAFACKLAEGSAIVEAARFANAAAALSVTHVGAQSSIPARQEVEKFLGV